MMGPDRGGSAGRKCVAVLMPLLLSLLALCLPLSVPMAYADGSGPISPFPTTGAFNATFVRDQEHISIIEFVGDYNRDLPSLQSRAVVAKEFFRTHPDNYDFLVVFSTFEFDTGEAAAFQWAIQNQVQGIGLPLYDVSNLFGSDGKLQGYTDMAAISRWTFNPLDPS